MKKKKRQKATKDVDRVRKERRTEPEKAASNEEEFPGGTDYGGLPDRDLKKNLGGCG